MEFHFINVKAIENIHAGRANASTDSIDKVVQRDIGGIPCVESTSFKGALKEHFPSDPVNNEFVDSALGGEDKNGSSLSAGQYGIKQLDLLALQVPIHPVPMKMYSTVPVTSWEILDRLYEAICLYLPEVETCKGFQQAYIPFREANSSSHFPLVFAPPSSNVTIPALTCLGKCHIRLTEGNALELPQWLERIVFNDFDLNKCLVICDSRNFDTLISDFELPNKHRNKIDWGESKNLWVEQFLPRGTHFITKIRVPDVLYKKDNSNIESHLEIFMAQVDNVCIQVGANKSVGYGECYFKFL